MILAIFKIVARPINRRQAKTTLADVLRGASPNRTQEELVRVISDTCRSIQGLESFSSGKGQEGTLQTPVWCLAHIPDKEE